MCEFVYGYEEPWDLLESFVKGLYSVGTEALLHKFAQQKGGNMAKMLTIMFDDLNKETQKEVLEFYSYNSPEDGNLDVVPLFILEKEEEERKG